MFSRTLTNVGAGVALAAALALGTGAAAYAHECYNPSRSDQGDAKAGANSQAWFTLVVNDAIQGDATNGFITQEQADCIKAAYAGSGAPFGRPKAIAACSHPGAESLSWNAWR